MSAVIVVALVGAMSNGPAVGPESVRAMSAILTGRQFETPRRWAAEWFRRHAEQPLVAAAFDALVVAAGSDPVPVVRAAAVTALGTICKCRPRPVPDAVRRALTDTSEEVFEAAGQALKAEKPLSAKSVTALIAVAESNDPERRWRAYFALCWDGRHDPATVAALRRGTADPNPKGQRAARLGLTYVTGELDGTVQFILRFHALAAGLDDLPATATAADREAAYFRAVAAFSDFAVLGSIMRKQADKAVAVLTGMMAAVDDRDDRLAAVWYLATQREADDPLLTPVVRARLVKLATDDPDRKVRQWAVIARDAVGK